MYVVTYVINWTEKSRCVVVRCPLLFSVECRSEKNRGWSRASSQYSVAPSKGSRARRDGDNARVDSGPTGIKRLRLNRLLIQLRRQTTLASRSQRLDPFTDNAQSDFDNQYFSLHHQKRDQSLLYLLLFKGKLRDRAAVTLFLGALCNCNLSRSLFAFPWESCYVLYFYKWKNIFMEMNNF